MSTSSITQSLLFLLGFSINPLTQLANSIHWKSIWGLGGSDSPSKASQCLPANMQLECLGRSSVSAVIVKTNASQLFYEPKLAEFKSYNTKRRIMPSTEANLHQNR